MAAVLRQDQHVLDPHPQLPRQIDARLGGDHRPGGQGLGVGGGGIGPLVDLHPHAVAEAVAEVRAVAGAVDDVSGGLVHVVAGGAGPGGGDARQLGLQHRVIDPAHLLRHGPHRNGAGHVGAVAVVDAAEVHGDELPGLDGLLRGDPVGQAPVGAGHHDGVEGHVLRPVVEHEILEPGGDLLLRDAGADLVQDLRQGLLCDPLGGDQDLQLLRVLDGPQLREQVRRRHQLAGQGAGQGLVLPDGHVRVLKSQAADVVAADGLPQQRGIAPAGGHLLDDGPPDVPLRSLRVPGVGHVIASVPGHQGHAVGAGGVEAGGVKAVGLVGQQHGVQTVTRQLSGDLRKVVHTIPPRPALRRGRFHDDRLYPFAAGISSVFSAGPHRSAPGMSP